MPWGQDGTFLWLCVRWGRDKGEKLISILIRTKCPSLSDLPKNGRFRKGCVSTVGKR